MSRRRSGGNNALPPIIGITFNGLYSPTGETGVPSIRYNGFSEDGEQFVNPYMAISVGKTSQYPGIVSSNLYGVIPLADYYDGAWWFSRYNATVNNNVYITTKELLRYDASGLVQVQNSSRSGSYGIDQNRVQWFNDYLYWSGVEGNILGTGIDISFNQLGSMYSDNSETTYINAGEYQRRNRTLKYIHNRTFYTQFNFTYIADNPADGFTPYTNVGTQHQYIWRYREDLDKFFYYISGNIYSSDEWYADTSQLTLLGPAPAPFNVAERCMCLEFDKFEFYDGYYNLVTAYYQDSYRGYYRIRTTDFSDWIVEPITMPINVPSSQYIFPCFIKYINGRWYVGGTTRLLYSTGGLDFTAGEYIYPAPITNTQYSERFNKMYLTTLGSYVRASSTAGYQPQTWESTDGINFSYLGDFAIVGLMPPDEIGLE